MTNYSDSDRSPADAVSDLFAAVIRRFRTSRHALPGSDLTPRMLAALGHLADAGPLTLGELAIHMRCSKATISELATRLEQRGLIDRIRDERDRRQVFLWLTDDGRMRVAHGPTAPDDSFAAAIGRLSEADLHQLMRGLEALLAAAPDPPIHQEDSS